MSLFVQTRSQQQFAKCQRARYLVRPDGIPSEFYQIFAALVVPLLVKVFNKAWELGELPQVFFCGDIVLLPKKGDAAELNNKRPITLLNTKYKLFAKVWQRRLTPIAQQLITWNQSAFLPACSIHHTVLFCLETLHYTRSNSILLVFLQIDFCKAYDKVLWTFLSDLFKALNFSPWFQLVLQEIT
jgi:hypothetical protein